jgi:hypothetical protein
MIDATITSGQPVPVPNTRSAASKTGTSLRVQTHAGRYVA